MSVESPLLPTALLAASLVIGSVAAAGTAAFEQRPPAASLEGELEAKLAREFDASAQAMRQRIRALADGDERAARLAEQSHSAHRARYLELRAQRLQITTSATAFRSPFAPDFSAPPLTSEDSVAREAGATWDLYSGASSAGSAPARGDRSWGLYGSSESVNAVLALPDRAYAPGATGHAANPFLVYRAQQPEDRRTP